MPALEDQILITGFESYRSYFQALTTDAKFLDFFSYTPDEFEKASSNPARSGWCMILEPYESDVRDNNASQLMQYCRGMFIIAKKKTNELKWFALEEQAEIKAKKIIGRIKHDKREGVLLTQLSNFTLQTIDPMTVSDYYGVVVSFSFEIPINAASVYTESDWNL